MKRAQDRNRLDATQELGTFILKHAITLNRAGLVALDLRKDPARAQDHLLSIWVRQRPEGSAKRTETAFYVCAAEAVSYDIVPPNQAKRLKDEIKRLDETLKDLLPNMQGIVFGHFFIEIACVDTGAVCSMPAQATAIDVNEIPPPPKKSEWKDWLFHKDEQWHSGLRMCA
jgi:hypothetical protein